MVHAMLMPKYIETFLAEAAHAVPSSNGWKPVAERRNGDASALARRHAS
jgi:hypothetical protein